MTTLHRQKMLEIAKDPSRDEEYSKRLGLEVRTIPGFPMYLISRNGRLFTKRPYGKYVTLKERVTFVHPHKQQGYRFIPLHDFGGKGSRQKNCKIARLVAITYIGPPPSPIHQVDHIDSNRTNDNVENLRWVTPKENMANVKALGHMRLGEDHPMAKLKQVQVDAIRRIAECGANHSDIAILLNVQQPTVSGIVRGATWKS